MLFVTCPVEVGALIVFKFLQNQEVGVTPEGQIVPVHGPRIRICLTRQGQK